MRNFNNMLQRHLSQRSTNNSNSASQMLENLLQNNKVDVSTKLQIKAFAILLKAIEKVAVELLQSDNHQIKALCKIVYSEKLPSKYCSKFNIKLRTLGAYMVFMHSDDNKKNSSIKNFNVHSLATKSLYQNFQIQDECILLIIKFIDGNQLYYGIHKTDAHCDLELYFGTTSEAVISERLRKTVLMLSTEYSININEKLAISCNNIIAAEQTKDIERN